LRVLVEAYNQARGWSAQGWIPESQLAELKNCGIPVKNPRLRKIRSPKEEGEVE